MRQLLITLALALPGSALASALDDYKDQKHGDRERVTAATCPQAYIEAHPEMAGDPQALDKAEAFCDERSARKTRKTVEVVAKGASVGAGAAAVVAENAVVKAAASRAASPPPPPTHDAVTKDGVTKPTSGPAPRPRPQQRDKVDPFAFQPSLVAELGGGLPSGVIAGTGVVRTRSGIVGAGLSATAFGDADDWLADIDAGPVFYIGSPHIEFGIQPSVLMSAGNGVDTEFGLGARSYTTVELGRVLLFFDPMLGRINHNWNYNLRAGVGYRFTPNVYGRVSYDYRDVLDLGDLDISQASMQGVFVTGGVRF